MQNKPHSRSLSGKDIMIPYWIAQLSGVRYLLLKQKSIIGEYTTILPN